MSSIIKQLLWVALVVTLIIGAAYGRATLYGTDYDIGCETEHQLCLEENE